ncbi:MliC family protein [Nitrosomonas sp.]|uniref:MliC family protein n=1 Tax=Nitrosomonas sp. TaxID=42353 RepID=UPI002600E17A|nr:MliC family protein [Nitrosomonas sp.]
MTLAVSASGARFVAGKNEWWEHQGEATYSVNDELVNIANSFCWWCGNLNITSLLLLIKYLAQNVNRP